MGNQLCKGATDEIDEHTRSAPSEASPTKMPETLDRPSSGSSAARNSGGVRKSGGSLNKSGEPTGRTGSPNKSAWARRRVWHGEGQGSLRRMPKVHEKSTADRHAVKEAVLGCTVLGALPDRQLDALIDCMSVQTLAPGLRIDISDCLCVVLEGEMRLSTNEASSRTAGPGSVEGEVGLLHDRGDRGTLSAVALSAGRVCKLTRKAFCESVQFSQQAMIKANVKLISSVPLFEKLSMPERLQLADACELRTFHKGEAIVREGEPGEHFFVIRWGGAAVTRTLSDGRVETIDYKYPGDHFGEGALINNAPRGATVTAAKEATEVLAIGRETFVTQLPNLSEVLARTEGSARDMMLLDVPLLGELTAETRNALLGRLNLEDFADGETVFEQGDAGDKLYIIKSGEVVVLRADEYRGASPPPVSPRGRQLAHAATSPAIISSVIDLERERAAAKSPRGGRDAPPPTPEDAPPKLTAARSLYFDEVELDHLYRGQYFGERALLKREPRMAKVKAVGALQCYSLSKDDFDALDIKSSVPWERRWEREDTKDASQLTVVGAMGAGAFGTAWLVEYRRASVESPEKPRPQYALKSLDKAAVQRGRWTAVVMREKEILASLAPHPCVVALHNTYQDEKHLFMLMELVAGGELYQLMLKQGRFSEPKAKFYSACIASALAHLHRQRVVYRDLKPENLLLDSRGYLKLIDMGFAKRLAAGTKTFTMCGTPYYLAPEMIQHFGHDLSLDWWTLGVVTFEMLAGNPPFLGGSEIEVYNKVLKLSYTQPSGLSDTGKSYLKKLMTSDPRQRLGNLRGGAHDVMGHAWFAGVDFDKLLAGTLKPPYVPDPNTRPKPSRKLKNDGTVGLDATIEKGSPSYWLGW